MSVQTCPYHERLQRDFNGLTEMVCELKEWRAAQDERLKHFEEKIDQAVVWMKWAVGLSITSTLAVIGAIATLIAVIVK